jgi:anti-sigma-K factor RskA
VSRGGDASASTSRGSGALPGWLAAAAALVLASALGLWALQLRGSLEAMNARVERAESEVVRIQRTVDEAQQQTRILQAHNSVMFAPDTLRIDLAGEGPAPASKARAFMSRHSGVVFVADALPALPPGQVYQLWVVPQNAAPVSAGLLRPDPRGHTSLFVPMPANVSVAAALAVTVEPAGGLPAPTGARVLLGAVPATTAG